MTQERIFHHYDRIVKDIKEIIDDPEMTDEEKIRVLGVIL